VRSQFNWSQYRRLIQIDNPDKREFYEQEALHNCWSGREMERQIDSGLYERLLASSDKKAVLAVARQKRIVLEDDEFFIDLVFYNRLLRCFVLIELKTKKITHEDLGQLQMYVNYYDRIEKLPEENPTIGILLCANKNDAVVKFSLPENNSTILARQYQLYLPSEKELLAVLKTEIIKIKR
jgi:hypothetical protein